MPEHTRPAASPHEARLLDAARHPGVAELLGPEPAPGGGGRDGELRLWIPDGPRLAELAPGTLSPGEIAGMVAATGATIADLHGRGLVCGPLEPASIVLEGGVRPVLLSLPGTNACPADDVSDLGRLVAALLGPDPDRRGPARALARIAEQVRAAPVTERPSAAALAAALRHAVPGAGLPAARIETSATSAGAPAPDFGPTALDQLRVAVAGRGGRWRGRPAPRRARGAAAASVVVLALLTPLLASGSPSPGAASPASTSTSISTSTPTSTATSTTTSRPATTSTSTTGLRWEAGVLHTPGGRYQVGQPGDVVLIGDWDCDGRETLALFRPATGQVFVFSTWAGPVTDAVAEEAAVVAGGTGARSVDGNRDGCDDIEVTRAADAPVVVRPRAPN